MIQAKCHDCRDIHPLQDRKLTKESLTTRCPSCNSPSYETVYDGETIKKSESERIADSLSHVGGVGEEILRRIQEKFSTKAELDSASEEELLSIEGVGPQTAANIINVSNRSSE